MVQYKHTPFDEEIFEAMAIFNIDKPSVEKFTLVDSRIISLVHSYNYSNKTFFASNEYLANKCLTTPATIQKSINRLISHGLIEKQVSHVNGKKQRTLIYSEEGSKIFKDKLGVKYTQYTE